MDSIACPIPKEISLNYQLLHKDKADDNLRHLLLDLSRAAKSISYAIQTTDTGLSGNTNSSGEDQLALDVLCDDILRQHLCETGLTNSYVSEEKGDVVELNPGAPYTVVFDPLDGSSLVDANFSIGTIIGIYEGDDIIGRTPREQVGAMYVLYGPRTLLTYSVGNGVHTFLLNDIGEYVLINENIQVEADATNYSPGNLRAVNENAKYQDLVNSWLDDALTLRYSGCMVADIHHIFSKGQGIFTNVGGAESKYPNGKLRLVFECGPFAYLAEQAGAAASAINQDVLDVTITELHQRVPLVIGSKNDVAKVSQALA